MFDFKEFRKANKLTQIEAAAYFGCAHSFISMIETGKSAIPQAWREKIMADPKLDKSMIGAVNEKKAPVGVKENNLIEALQSEIETLKRINDYFIEANNKQLEVISSQQRMLEAQQVQVVNDIAKPANAVKGVQ